MLAADALLSVAGDLANAAAHQSSMPSDALASAAGGIRLLVKEARVAAATGRRSQYETSGPIVSVVAGRLTVDATDVPLGTLLDRIAQQHAFLAIEGRPEDHERVSVQLQDVPLARGLRAVLQERPYSLLSTGRETRLLLGSTQLSDRRDPMDGPAQELGAQRRDDQIGDDGPSHLLASLLTHEDDQVRLQVVEVLRLLGGEDAAALLEYVWAGDPSLGVRDAAWTSLEQLSSAGAEN